MVVPRGLIQNAKIKIGSMEFLVNLVVLTMQTPTPDSYQVLIGRPWLKDAKVKHDWNRDRISIRKGKKKAYIEFGQSKTTRIEKLTPLHAETCNMPEGLEEDAEAYFLQQNPNLVPLFIVRLDKLVHENKRIGKRQNTPQEGGDMEELAS